MLPKGGNPFAGPERFQKPEPGKETKIVHFRFDEITMMEAISSLEEDEIEFKTMPKTPGKPQDGTVFLFEEQSDALLFRMNWEDQDKGYQKGIGGKTG